GSLDPGFSAGNLINVPSPRHANLIRVVPGDPDASVLIQKLQGADGLLGDRMPDGGPYLTTATINVIRQWIQDRALQGEPEQSSRPSSSPRRVARLPPRAPRRSSR